LTPVPVTLVTAAAAVFVNLWLGWRVITARRVAGVRLGDGGNEAVLRRMRAQANFIENAPFFLILLGGLELSGASWRVLALVATLFVLARISHAVGMDGGSLTRWRVVGMMSQTIALVTLAVWAVVCALENCLGG
jgi:uncharacterized membrane protein YecN with MAPEG domain